MLRAEADAPAQGDATNGLSRQKEDAMRMVRRIALYIGLVLLAVLLSAGVAYAAGVWASRAQWRPGSGSARSWCVQA